MTERRQNDRLMMSHIEEDKKRFDIYDRVLFGDKNTGEMGMKEKVDDMHEILVQLKGWKSLLGVILLVGAVIATLKGWFH